MPPTQHDKAMLEYLDRARFNLTSALGAFIFRFKDLPEMHAELLRLSQEVDALAEGLQEIFEQ